MFIIFNKFALLFDFIIIFLGSRFALAFRCCRFPFYASLFSFVVFLSLSHGLRFIYASPSPATSTRQQGTNCIKAQNENRILINLRSKGETANTLAHTHAHTNERDTDTNTDSDGVANSDGNARVRFSGFRLASPCDRFDFVRFVSFDFGARSSGSAHGSRLAVLSGLLWPGSGLKLRAVRPKTRAQKLSKIKKCTGPKKSHTKSRYTFLCVSPAVVVAAD